MAFPLLGIELGSGPSSNSNNDKDVILSKNYVSELGKVRFGKRGALRVGEESNAEIVVDFFFDPACSACADRNDKIEVLLEELLEKEKIELIYHPVAYLNDKTPDDYSNRAAAYMLASTEYVPDKALQFIHSVESKDFLSDSPGTTITPDSKFITLMEDLDYTVEEIDQIESNKESFVSNVIAGTQDFIKEDSKWIEFSSYAPEGEKALYTPFLLVNKKGERTTESIEIIENETIIELIKEINNENKSIVE